MKPDGPMKHFILAFLLAVTCYVVFYKLIEHRRTRKGPWEVTFTTTPDGVPSVVINEPKLSISNFQIIFPDQPSPPTNALYIFRDAKPVPFQVPFGKCLFMDTTFLPGSLAFELFDHQIELLPRALMVDHQEHPWVAGRPITLHTADK
jgi:hypothetical protein